MSRWPNFSDEELGCKCCGASLMNPVFMDLVQEARTATGFPWPVTSGYRCKVHDAEVGSSAVPGTGPHTTGAALDVRVNDPARACSMIGALFQVGVFDWTPGPDRKFLRGGLGMIVDGRGNLKALHIDFLQHPDRTRPWIWTDVSQEEEKDEQDT